MTGSIIEDLVTVDAGNQSPLLNREGMSFDHSPNFRYFQAPIVRGFFENLIAA